MKYIFTFLILIISSPTLSTEYKHGIAINPLRLAINGSKLDGGGHTYSASYSIFNTLNGTEHVLPIFYGKDTSNHNPFEIITAEYQFRNYSKPISQGSNRYFGGFIKAAHIEANNRVTYFELDSTFKIGAGIVFGYTYFQNNMYVSANLQIGQYFTGESSHFSSPSINFTENNDKDTIVTIEFLKVGFVF